jgi:predicted alpha/beta-fold hydrolase
VDRIAVPTLVVTAEDDPFVPSGPFHDAALSGNAQVTRVITRHGGHCAFVEAARAGYDGYWAEREIVRFATACQRDARP